ncbi:MAG: hypothetical protein NWF06_08155 [Candidatus Bathyarchaeota archaeon]|nr:hypothetical protein [Candidatus Bathyarchaeum sp.]
MNRDRTTVLEWFSVFVVIALFSFSCYIGGVYAKSETVFTKLDTFDIPLNNSSISFATDGTYEKAILDNNVWNFDNLRFEDSPNSEMYTIKISAEDCKLTITYCRIYNSTFAGQQAKGARLRYTVIGRGTQFFDFGLDPKGGDWGVIFDDEYMKQNEEWSLSTEGTLTIMGATENVTLSYYGFPESFVNTINGSDNSILNQHSVVIVITIVSAIVVLSAAVIMKKKVEFTY